MVIGRQLQSFIETRAAIQQEDNMPEEDELDHSILKDYNFDKLNMTTLKDLTELGE